MSSPIVIPGFTSSDKAPGAVLETLYGQGKQSVGSAPLLCLCTGNKTSAGAATPDQDVVQIFSYADADFYAGPGSEGAMQLYAMLDVGGATIWYAPVAEATAGPVAASLTITIGGSWTTGGTIITRLAGKNIQTNVGPSDATTLVATNMALAINGTPRLPMTANAVGSVVTVTVRNVGVRGNDYVCVKDTTAAPAGLTCVLAGGTALTGGVTPFSAGAGADSVANVLALLTTQTWDFQAWAQNDSTNLALIKAQIDSQSGPLVMHPGVAVVAKTRTTSASITLAQVTANDPQIIVGHFTNSESHPCFLAAQLAAIFAVDQSSADNPNVRFLNRVLPTAAPQSQKGDILQRSTVNALLNAGVTPITTTPDGKVVIVDAIQSHSLNGSSPDFRTYHVGDTFTTIRLSKEIGALWDFVSAQNQYAGPDPATGENPPPSGVLTPSLWGAELTSLLKDREARNWLQDVDANPPLVVYDTTAKRIMSAVIAIVRSQNIQLGNSTRQTASA